MAADQTAEIEIQRLTALCKSADAEMERMNIANEQLRSAVLRLVDERDEAERQRMKETDRLNSATAANADLTDRLDRTLHELRGVAGHAREVAWTSVQGRDAEIDGLRTELNAANAALEKHIDLLDEARSERDAARAELEELRAASIEASERQS
jgi:chromosome segregation ATPase